MALALIRPAGKLARNNQMDTEACEQRAGKTINPLRQTLIATTHFRERKQAGDHGKPRQGAAYLIWLGIQQWRAAGAIDLNTMANTQSRSRLFKRAVFVNLTNPKSIVFLAALFPQFILPQEPQLMQYVVLGVTTIVVDIIVMIGYATLATRIAGWIKGPKQMKALNKVFGSLFMLIGALLASARHA